MVSVFYCKWWDYIFGSLAHIRIHILQSSVQSAISILQPPTFKGKFKKITAHTEVFNTYNLRFLILTIFRVKVVFSKYIHVTKHQLRSKSQNLSNEHLSILYFNRVLYFNTDFLQPSTAFFLFQEILFWNVKKNFWKCRQRYTYRVLQTIQMKINPLGVWA